MRFIDHDQMLILEQHHFVERNARLSVHRAVVVEPPVGLVRTVRRQCQAVFIDHLALDHALAPDFGRNCGEALDQESQRGWPCAGR